MKLLIIDTALDLCTIGLFAVADRKARPLAMRSEAMSKGHQERLGVLAQEVKTQAGGFDRIERIGVTVGPGSFTGLRVGLSFAQGLGAALGVPVVGLSTLDALAEGRTDAAALIDARRGQVYARIWKDGAPTDQPRALDLETARAAISDLNPEQLIGSGALLFGVETPQGRLGPDPAALARLAARLDPSTNPPTPLYLRAPDATPPTRLPGQARPART